ncbi:MAG: KGG domain-containing protein [Candidatus Daviesbacteria bacterium]|nr:KGG domain-containing protein [Candidatus Daviesbacteria bacterium]
MTDDSTRGFGSMDEEKRKEIARKGGQASHGGQNMKASSDMDEGKGRQGDQSENMKMGEEGMGSEDMMGEGS